MYYAYPNVNPELLVDLGSSYVLANANFDVNYYNYQDIIRHHQIPPKNQERLSWFHKLSNNYTYYHIHIEYILNC